MANLMPEVAKLLGLELGAGVIGVSDSVYVAVRPRLRDVQPLTDSELKDYMRIGCLKWCR